GAFSNPISVSIETIFSPASRTLAGSYPGALTDSILTRLERRLFRRGMSAATAARRSSCMARAYPCAVGRRLGHHVHLLARFRLFGVPVSVHPSSVVVVLLLGWLSGYQRPATLGIWAGVVYVSLLIHELGHALTARSIGSDVSIELNGFGGLTRWTTPEGG